MSIAKKSPVTLGVMALSGALIISTPATASSAESISDATVITDKTSEDLNNYESFTECPAADSSAPEVTDVGSRHGPGISELLTEETRRFVSEGRAEQGKSPLPENSHALRYLDSGAIYAVDETGAIVLELASADPLTDPGEFDVSGAGLMAASSWSGVKDEAKAIIEACLGVGIFGGISAETITRWVGTPAKAAKFVVRRLGVFGAVSCAGGIIWRYV